MTLALKILGLVHIRYWPNHRTYCSFALLRLMVQLKLQCYSFRTQIDEREEIMIQGLTLLLKAKSWKPEFFHFEI